MLREPHRDLTGHQLIQLTVRLVGLLDLIHYEDAAVGCLWVAISMPGDRRHESVRKRCLAAASWCGNYVDPSGAFGALAAIRKRQVTRLEHGVPCLCVEVSSQSAVTRLVEFIDCFVVLRSKYIAVG